MNRRYTWVTVAGLLVIGQGALSAQVPQPPVGLWSVSVAAGGGSGRSSQGVEAAMRAGGFDDRSPASFFGPGRNHPFSRGGGLVGLLTVRRRFGKMAHVRAVMGGITLGQTHGYKAGQGFGGGYVFLKQSVSTYAIMAGINAQHDAGPWVAAGPALHGVALEHMESAGGPAVTANRLGAVVALGVVFPPRKQFFVELQGQYRLVGTVDLGPIDVARTGGGTAGTLPRTGVNFNHWVLLLGVGARL